MTFEEQLREKIKAAPFGSSEKNVLKLVLGELQQEMGNVTDERGHSIVKKLITSNEECLGHLDQTDPRYAGLVAENEMLQSLLPQYWSEDQIRARLEADGVDVTSFSNEGQATGAAMKHLKGLGAPVEGGTVKSVVAAIRAS